MEKDDNSVDEKFKAIIDNYDTDSKTHKYLVSLDDKSKVALMIAKEHLGSSFHLNKSNGYVAHSKSK